MTKKLNCTLGMHNWDAQLFTITVNGKKEARFFERCISCGKERLAPFKTKEKK